MRLRYFPFHKVNDRSFARARTVAPTPNAGKGFGTSQKQNTDASGASAQSKAGVKDKKVAQDAAAIAGGRPGHRPVRPEEAARGKLDYVQVADWGDGDRAKLGELRLVSHVPQYEGGAVGAASGSGSGSNPAAAGSTDPDSGAGSAGSGGGRSGGAEPRPLHVQLAHQLRLAESRGALAVAGPPPPPLAEWSFSEGRYVQYLTDCLEVHSALEDALREATATAGGAAAGPDQPCAARAALLHLAPGRLGLERSGALRDDLAALRSSAATAAAAAAAAPATEATSAEVAEAPAEAAVAGPGPGAEGRGEGAARRKRGAGEGGGAAAAPPPRQRKGLYDCTAGPMARSYAHVLRRLGRVAGGGESEQERHDAALRLLAHAAVLHMSGQAAAIRCGAAATERLGLLQRRAAATYHDYPEGIRDPRVTLSAALDAAGSHLAGSPVALQVVFDELPGAMQKTGLLLTALAHRD